MVQNLQVPYKSQIFFFSSWATVRFPRRTLLPGILSCTPSNYAATAPLRKFCIKNGSFRYFLDLYLRKFSCLKIRQVKIINIKFEFNKLKVAATAVMLVRWNVQAPSLPRNIISNGKVSRKKAIQFYTVACRTVPSRGVKWKANKEGSRCCYRFFDWRIVLPIGTRFTGISCSISCFFSFPSCESETFISYFRISFSLHFKSPCDPPRLLTRILHFIQPCWTIYSGVFWEITQYSLMEGFLVFRRNTLLPSAGCKWHFYTRNEHIKCHMYALESFLSVLLECDYWQDINNIIPFRSQTGSYATRLTKYDNVINYRPHAGSDTHDFIIPAHITLSTFTRRQVSHIYQEPLHRKELAEVDGNRHQRVRKRD